MRCLFVANQFLRANIVLPVRCFLQSRFLRKLYCACAVLCCCKSVFRDNTVVPAPICRENTLVPAPFLLRIPFFENVLLCLGRSFLQNQFSKTHCCARVVFFCKTSFRENSGVPAPLFCKSFFRETIAVPTYAFLFAK